MNPARESILVLGSGPIRIGQAAEFDYSGSQACRALKDEGYRVILLNSNPATIQTDVALADVVYIRPLTAEVVESILREHRPHGVIATLGGQTALNLLVELHEKGLWDQYGVQVLGTPVETVKVAEGRESFRNLMKEIGEPVVESVYAGTVDEAVAFADECPFPLVIRPDFTLGGTGGGVAYDTAGLRRIAREGLDASPVHRVLVERFLAGWSEIEIEVVRDGRGHALAVCGMENVDGMGIHTGDSIVVAPVLTLTDRQWQMFRTSALRIVNSLDVRGACNVQFALHPGAEEYAVIEVNPRASRSSALASKATGYPIARMAARIALGHSLAEMPNPVTGQGSALSEPALDYVVVKFPRWPFDKFPHADNRLGTRMKATGEVMSIGLNFTQALLKAVRSLEQNLDSLRADLKERATEELISFLENPDHRRIWVIFELQRRGRTSGEIARYSGIHSFFLDQLNRIVSAETRLAAEGISPELLRHVKILGFSDEDIARIAGISGQKVHEMRLNEGIVPGYREVDGCAGETPAGSGYLYGVYGAASDEDPDHSREAVAVIGSGPIRIGQGIEFDYCCVKAVEALSRRGYRTVMLNNNPETVSTDHDLSDALYFEPLTTEDILPVLDRERVKGVFSAFGGQTSLKAGQDLHRVGIPILGTSYEAVQAAEDRGLFSEILDELQVAQPQGAAARNRREALALGDSMGFPLMVRPSFVIGGLAMRLCSNRTELEEVLDEAFAAESGQSVLVDRFLPGREFEVDAVCDGDDVLIPGIFEHLDPAGIHSGDSMAIFPDISLSPTQREEVVRIVTDIAGALDVRGFLNVQFVLNEGRIVVIEANPRASRTVPIASKLSGLPLVDLAVGVALGDRIAAVAPATGLLPYRGPYGVKVPVFSTEKLPGVDALLGVQMQSTGESLGVSGNVAEALCNALEGAGWRLPEKGKLLLSVCDGEKPSSVHVAAAFAALGWEIQATPGTAAFLEKWGLSVSPVPKGEKLCEKVREKGWDMIFNVPGTAVQAISESFTLRRAAIESGILCLNNLQTASGLALALAASRQ